jgi:hypothetical protein
MSFQFGLICVVVFAGLCIIFFALLFRHHKMQLAHAERMAALEKGIAIPTGQTAAPWSPRVYLLRGLIWSVVGATLTLAMFLAAVSTPRHRHDPQWIAFQARTLSQNLEIPIDEARKMAEKDAQRAEEETGAPVALAAFGLIPLGVGLAYLVFYRAEASKAGVPPR